MARYNGNKNERLKPSTIYNLCPYIDTWAECIPNTNDDLNTHDATNTHTHRQNTKIHTKASPKRKLKWKQPSKQQTNSTQHVNNIKWIRIINISLQSWWTHSVHNKMPSLLIHNKSVVVFVWFLFVFFSISVLFVLDVAFSLLLFLSLLYELTNSHVCVCCWFEYMPATYIGA